MALQKCKECAKEISSKADQCPHCGVKIRRTSPLTMGCAVVLFFLLGVAVLSTMLGGGSSGTGSSAPPASQKKDLNAAVRHTGTQFVISNNDTFPWNNCTVSLNREGVFGDAFELKVARLDSAAVYTVGAMQFAKPDGTRFNPFQMKPQKMAISCDEGFYAGGWQ